MNAVMVYLFLFHPSTDRILKVPKNIFTKCLTLLLFEYTRKSILKRFKSLLTAI